MNGNLDLFKAIVLADMKRMGFAAWAATVLQAGSVQGVALDAPSRHALRVAQGWHDFTRRWVAERRRLGRAAHYCPLAVAMARADGQRQPWDYYLRQARWHLVDVFAQEEAAARARYAT